MLAQVGRNAAVAALLGAFGVCVGALVRNQVVAIVGVLRARFVVEPTAPRRWSPTSVASARCCALPGGIHDIDDDPELLAPGVAALAMLGWITVTYVAGALLLNRRDLD